MNTLLDIVQLRVSLPTARGTVQAVRGVNLQVQQGEMLALVGESGCGKSVTAQAIMGLLPDNANVTGTTLHSDQKKMAMIFQNPMATFNPVLTIGYQIAEPLRVLHKYKKNEAEAEAIRLLERMHIHNAAQKIHCYAHEFSGGMLQRAAIAMALACKPQLLIADEPTTALDVSTQHEVMQLLSELRHEEKLGILFITHDLGLVSRHADRVAVMYAGEIIESASTSTVLDTPAHPYTQALLAALPSRNTGKRLYALEGTPPDLRQATAGCAFAPRCAHVMLQCTQQAPPVCEPHFVRCWLPQKGIQHE